MNVFDLKYFRYNLPFVEPLRSALGSIVNREGLIILLTDSDGNKAFGEIAPLESPGMTGINDCVSQIEQIKSMLDPKNDIEMLVRNEIFSPEVKFGLEQAMHSLMLIRSGDKTSSPGITIRINALLGLNEDEEIFRKVGSLIEEGYTTLKIKIDNTDIDNKLELLNHLAVKYGSAVKFRIDANGSLNYNEASEVLSRLNPDSTEYIEDPLTDVDNLIRLQEKSAVRIALDEPLTPQSIHDMLEIPEIKYYVIKPVKFGFFKTMEIIKSGGLKNKIIVVSSMFESAVGRSALVYLASLIGGVHAHGLDTGKFLAEDLAGGIYPCDKPMVEFFQDKYPPVFNLQDMFK